MFHVLVDGGATVNLVLNSMLSKLGKTSRDLVQTNIAMTNFNGKTIVLKIRQDRSVQSVKSGTGPLSGPVNKKKSKFSKPVRNR